MKPKLIRRYQRELVILRKQRNAGLNPAYLRSEAAEMLRILAELRGTRSPEIREYLSPTA